MKYVTIKEIQAGMTLAADVRSADGRVLVAGKTVLTPEIIQRIKERGLSSLAIDDERSEDKLEFDDDDFRKAKELYREVVEERFLNRNSDPMTERLFQTVLDYSSKKLFLSDNER